jgi:hypothetical protein
MRGRALRNAGAQNSERNVALLQAAGAVKADITKRCFSVASPLSGGGFELCFRLPCRMSRNDITILFFRSCAPSTTTEILVYEIKTPSSDIISTRINTGEGSSTGDRLILNYARANG